jgi:hypothetical protein
MKSVTFAVIIAVSVLGGRAAYASSDDAKWIAQCATDNKDEKAGPDVILKYCTCMNNKMDANETQSITQWEKTHATERTACDKEAGWK